MFKEKGLVQIYTGEGKGKTTSALGLALRALGHGASVVVIQFMKGWDSYGELRSALKLENMKIIQTGRPDYVYKGKELPEDYEEAKGASKQPAALWILASATCSYWMR